MSTRSTLLAAFGPRVQIRDGTLVPDGSVERLSLKRLPDAHLDTVAAARALVRRHLPVKAAHAVMTDVFDTGEAYVEVPKVESLSRLTSELTALGIAVRKHAPDPISVRSVREALHLSQAQFALRFGLEEATVKNWEQGKSRPNATAMTLIWTIHRHPEAVVDALATCGAATEADAASALRAREGHAPVDPLRRPVQKPESC
ncbi:helix-turn-helix domain-containing protein [Methylobacterium sp. WL116]|nr:helix-turn-helix domain-containing protein [Methylobacterium sp. WL116]